MAHLAGLTDQEAAALSAILETPPKRLLARDYVVRTLTNRGYLKWIGSYPVITSLGFKALRLHGKAQE